jgi:hypothetical protein
VVLDESLCRELAESLGENRKPNTELRMEAAK